MFSQKFHSFTKTWEHPNFGTGGGGLFIIDVSDPQAPFLLSQTPLGVTPDTDIATDVAIAGDLAFVTVSDGDTLMDGLAIFDVSDPTNPGLLSNVPFDTSVISDIAANEDSNLFVSSNPGLALRHWRMDWYALLRLTLISPLLAVLLVVSVSFSRYQNLLPCWD